MNDLPSVGGRAATLDSARVRGPHWSEQTVSRSACDSTRLLTASGIHRTFHKGGVAIPVLRGVDLQVQRGELVGIVGHSGSGKSTLLHVLGTLDAPDEGEVYLEEQRIDHLPARQRDRIRNQRLGMVFQFYHLLPELTTLENVLTPLMIGHSLAGYLRQRRAFRQQALELLEAVRLSHRVKHLPRELSGGEMQRAAIARALVTQPELLLADEPTGNLDRETGQEIVSILRNLNRQRGLTIVMVTHDEAVAAQVDRVVRLVDGRVQAA